MPSAWHCLDPACDQRGTTTGTESGGDAKHVKATGHATVSHVLTPAGEAALAAWESAHDTEQPA